MNYKVLFFTRTGNSKRIAEKIAKAFNSDPIEITDDKNWTGIFGFIRGGFYSATNRSVNIKVNGDTLDTDQYIVVTPIWAGVPTPAIKMFLKDVNVNKVNLVVSYQGSNVKKAINKFEQKIEKFNNVFSIVEKEDDEDKRITEIINILKN